jgi:methionyl-tRNA formyltransferase
VLNVHNSLLPKYRGRHAFTWALINGEPTVGFSLHGVDAGVDTGPIFAQVPIAVGHDDDINTLFERGWAILAEWLPEQLELFENGLLRPVPQEEAAATTFRARMPKDGEIGWAASRSVIRNFVRALRPPYTPGAFFVYEGMKHHVDQVLPVAKTEKSLVPGRVREVSRADGRLLVECGDGVLWAQVVGAQLGTAAPLPGALLVTTNR